MKTTVLWLLIGCASAHATGPWYPPLSDCARGQCPVVVAPEAPRSAAAIDARAIVRIGNTRGSSRSFGSGTLVDDDRTRGLVITCAHLFRDGAGTINVTFSTGRAFRAELARIDTTADLAALWIAAPGVEPVALASESPQRGDPLTSCGYGSDGSLACNRGQALGYVSTVGSGGAEVLELSGAARMGDSGGPVFNANRQLVAVLFGTNGRVVDGTACGRIRRFLAGLSPRFGAVPSAPPAQQPAPPAPSVPDDPLVRVAPPNESGRLARIEELIARLHEAWRGLGQKLESLAGAVESVKDALSNGRSPISPPQVGLPPEAVPLDPIAEAARPWFAARLTALLVSVGVPGGIAGVAAGTIVYVVMRRGKRRLQQRLARLQATGRPGTADAAAAEQAVVRHHNRYVPYEVTQLDKAWAAAHAHVGEKYPGAVPYLKMAEGVKDQLLSGNNDPSISEGRIT